MGGIHSTHGEKRNAYKIFVGNHKGEDQLEYKSVGGKLTLKWILNKLSMRFGIYMAQCSVQWPTTSSRNLSAFYRIQWFITVFSRVRHWSVSWASWIQSTTSHRITLIPISILSSSPKFVSSLHVFRLNLFTHFSSPICVLHSPR
jgi:hypothetical protein